MMKPTLALFLVFLLGYPVFSQEAGASTDVLFNDLFGVSGTRKPEAVPEAPTVADLQNTVEQMRQENVRLQVRVERQQAEIQSYQLDLSRLKEAGQEASPEVGKPEAVSKPRTLRILLSMAVLFLGGFLLYVLISDMSREDSRFTQERGWKLAGVIVVITAGLFLLTAQFPPGRILPGIGFLGVLLGYLIGKEDVHNG